MSLCRASKWVLVLAMLSVQMLESVLARISVMGKAPMMVNLKDPGSISKPKDAFFRLLITENIK